MRLAPLRRPARQLLGRWKPALASDTFVRGNSSSPGATNGLGFEAGQVQARTWVEIAGTWGITSNKLRLTSSFVDSQCAFDVGESDVLIDTLVRASGSGVPAGVVLRHVDASNEWRVVFTGTGTSTFQLVLIDATVESVEENPTVTGLLINTDYRIVVSARGAVIEGRLYNTSGVLLAEFRHSSATHQSATIHGAYGDPSTTVDFDRFTIRRPY